jgi:RNA polymerase II-associated factor 1
VKIVQDIANEFVLVFQDDNEEADENLFEDSNKRPKAAYYKNIERKINLKKKRVNVSSMQCYRKSSLTL